jgi:uroporphyrin-III C-methyltransferase
MNTARLTTSISQHGGALPWFLLFVLLLAALAGGWHGWQAMEHSQAAQGKTTLQLDSLLQAHEESVRAQQQQANLLQERLNTVERMLDDRDRQLKAMQEGGQRNWLLGEAEALAALAGQRLLLTADLAATRRLLESADKTLARINDPEVVTARRALAEDIEAVRGAEHVDVVALVLRLAAMQSLVAELAVPVVAEEPRAVVPLTEDALWWQRILHSLPINIQRQQDTPLPLDQQQAALLRLALDNSLQQAQMALLQGRAAVYHSALDQAEALIRSRFAPGDPRARHVLASLTELKEEAVHQALPDIGEGLAAIRQLKAGRAD